MNRREALATLASGLLLPSLRTSAESASPHQLPAPHIATNTYPWSTFARREQVPYTRHSEALLKRIASTGINGYEPIIESPTELQGLASRLATHGLEMRSIYVNSSLHDSTQSARSIDSVLAICNELAAFGTKIVVTNPSPIRWGGPEDKDDQQLAHQAESLDALGSQLRKLGLTLAYHNHDAELRQGAREFHHMLTATSSENVKFCLDSHWIFRGCGDSQIALFDAVEHYQDRIVELHLRQSFQGIWTEAFSMKGDIDYSRLFRHLRDADIQPHLVLEQAVEDGSPDKLGATQAHRQGRQKLLRAIT